MKKKILVVFLFQVNYLCKLTDVENDDAIVTNGLRKLIQSISMKNGPLIILAGVSRLHLLSERVLSLFSYTLSIPVRVDLFIFCIEICFLRRFRRRYGKNGFVIDC
jgi:hypothetical protein